MAGPRDIFSECFLKQIAIWVRANHISEGIMTLVLLVMGVLPSQITSTQLNILEIMELKERTRCELILRPEIESPPQSAQRGTDQACNTLQSDGRRCTPSQSPQHQCAHKNLINDTSHSTLNDLSITSLSTSTIRFSMMLKLMHNLLHHILNPLSLQSQHALPIFLSKRSHSIQPLITQNTLL